jgi:hypothetical protein
MDTAAVAIAGLAAAWLLYRLERAATRRREITAARAVLVGLWRGMVDGYGGRPGWGELYFTTNYTDEAAAKSGKSMAEDVLRTRRSQVVVVPTGPLEALIASAHAGDLISEATIYFANIGLWHLEVFNQLVVQQSHLLAQHLVRILDERLGERRRSLIANAIGSQATVLHRRGIGDPFTDGGWYRQLKESLQSDIARLDAELRKRWYPAGERGLVFGDATAAVAVLALSVILLATSTGGGTPVPTPQQPRTVTDPYR